MKKKNIRISRCEGLEVYCARDDFGYNCNNTPNNCTECPVMRFMYHDLTTRVLADKPAKELKAIVESSQAFSGKYDGHNAEKNGPLPAEVWTAIYAIRDAYYQCSNMHKSRDNEESVYATKDDTVSRFVKWTCESRMAKTTLEEIVQNSATAIQAGKLIGVTPDGKPFVYGESGVYMPAVFDSKTKGRDFLCDIICEKLGLDMFMNVGINPKKIVTEKTTDDGRYAAHISVYPDDIRYSFYMNPNGIRHVNNP